ncbi:MAG TPA: hypothetical protein VEU33_37615 [Archangium sp.]|nr:hypothetical protein [Archangium sp.]
MLIGLILAAAAALAVVILAIVYFDDIVKWFRSRNDIKTADKDNIAFTIKQKMSSGNYRVVQGIFNKETDQLVDGQVMQTNKVDDKLNEVHGNEELVIYD